jgi:alpha-2-macroglobulin
LAIGGDEFLNKKGKENNNRFKPVVLFQSPISIKAGETKTHEFYMPNYVGSVKVMVVAGQDGAYGNAEEVAPVKQDLMVLPTLPRIVSPTETISVPVTVFALDPNVKSVTVSLVPNTLFENIDANSKVVTFSKPGDQTIEFKVKVKSKIGQGKIIVNAVSGNLKATSETDLLVRVPAPAITKTISIVIEPGKSWTGKADAVGIAGTNSGMIEVSNTFPINVEQRLQYLITYPHGCIEQITSAAFPQLYLDHFVELSAERKAQIETNIKTCLEKLPAYKHSSGGFTYWPGETYSPSEWGTNYAGHFMVEAQNLGYKLPIGLLDAWIKHQTKEANNWSESAYRTDDIIQAYRLYTLALAKKPTLSAMNRLREYKNLSNAAKWRLAAAYVLAGRPEIAKDIINNLSVVPVKSQYYYYSYGSVERDMAMTLETLVLLKDFAKAKDVAIDLGKLISSEKWYSTQTTAYSLLALAKFASNPDKLEFTMTVGSQNYTCNTTKPMWQLPLDFRTDLSHVITIKNNSKFREYLQIQMRGVPSMKTTTASSQNLDMKVAYFDMSGKPINIKSLKQGTDFYIEVSVKHPGIRSEYQNIAIEQMFPSGWEIINTRMNEIGNNLTTNQSIRYQDIRDDRVFSYFTLLKGEKKVFRILLHASYVGEYYLPAVYCSEMYDNTIFATTVGEWIQVIK